MKNEKKGKAPLVELSGLHKYHYTDEIETSALNGLDLTIDKGEFLAIMGSSGSGKSTLLNIIGLIDDASKGSYKFLGKEVTKLGRKARSEMRKQHMGFIFQSFNLIDELTARENVELPLVYLKVPKKERRERVEQALAELEMAHRADHYPSQLSGGQQQRVAIARAIVSEPEIILADEPTGNLDSENSRAVMEKLTYLHQRGATIVMVTHDREDANYAERVIALFDGNILQEEAEFLAQKAN